LLSEKNNKIQFGLSLPQCWRGGDLPLEEENNAIKQFVFSKDKIITTINLGIDSIYVKISLSNFAIIQIQMLLKSIQ
jgi:hypothetical protein